MAYCNLPHKVWGLDDQEMTGEACRSPELLWGGEFGGDVLKRGSEAVDSVTPSQRHVEHPAGPVMSRVGHEVQTELLLCQLFPGMACR